jgi:UDP-N-acetylglucosamine 4,6-dehydratase
MNNLSIADCVKIFEGQSVLITGGTGSFGQQFVECLLERGKPRRVIVFSRDEMKQWHMSQKHSSDSRVRFFIGDVRDIERLNRALDGVDFVVHAAATKIVPTAEYNPFECVKTNVLGGMNVIDACINQKVKKVVALSTDKACSPANLYGATKLTSDKLFVNGNQYTGGKTKFSVVRYGNVLGSRGSVIPFFMEKRATGVLPITDERMTRFLITLQEAVDLVFFAFSDMVGSEIYIKKIPSINIVDLAKVIAPEAHLEFIGVRPGEKLHEQMISFEDSWSTYEYADYYKLLPQINDLHLDHNRIKNGKKVEVGFCYSSDTNSWWMSKSELKKWLQAHLAFTSQNS